MTIADEKSYLLAVSENGFGKRTLIGPNAPLGAPEDEGAADDSAVPDDGTTLDDDAIVLGVGGPRASEYPGINDIVFQAVGKLLDRF